MKVVNKLTSPKANSEAELLKLYEDINKMMSRACKPLGYEVEVKMDFDDMKVISTIYEHS